MFKIKKIRSKNKKKAPTSLEKTNKSQKTKQTSPPPCYETTLKYIKFAVVNKIQFCNCKLIVDKK